MDMKKKSLLILVACEESQRVCIELRKRGHRAYSCDILPCSGGHPEWHIQDYLEDVISSRKWDMIIAFPPCTYVCSSGLFRNIGNPARKRKTEYALRFVCMILNANCKRIVLENPVGCISTRIYTDPIDGCYTVSGKAVQYGIKPQYIQPYDFGEDASKKTGLWLKGVPPLEATKYIKPRIVNGKKRWSNQTDAGQNRETPHKDRALIRSKTYPGIARAMAQQWTEKVN